MCVLKTATGAGQSTHDSGVCKRSEIEQIKRNHIVAKYLLLDRKLTLTTSPILLFIILIILAQTSRPPLRGVIIPVISE